MNHNFFILKVVFFIFYFFVLCYYIKFLTKTYWRVGEVNYYYTIGVTLLHLFLIYILS